VYETDSRIYRVDQKESAAMIHAIVEFARELFSLIQAILERIAHSNDMPERKQDEKNLDLHPWVVQCRQWDEKLLSMKPIVMAAQERMVKIGTHTRNRWNGWAAYNKDYKAPSQEDKKSTTPLGSVFQLKKSPRYCRQEDRYCVAHLTMGETPMLLLGVFDGHNNSEKAAQYVQDRLPDYLQRRISFAKKENDERPGDKWSVRAWMPIAIQEACKDCDLNWLLRDSIETYDSEKRPIRNLSGTTIILAVVCEEMECVWAANLGDSELWMNRDGVAATFLKNHTGTLAYEEKNVDYKRIYDAGCKLIGTCCAPGHTHGERQLAKPLKTACKWSYRMGGMAITRSLGDGNEKGSWPLVSDFNPYTKGHRLGVPMEGCALSSDPDVHCEDLKSTDKGLLLGSDGLFDVMTGQEAIDCIAQCPDSVSAAERMVTMARERGSQDDITVLEFRFSWAAKGAVPLPLTTLPVSLGSEVVIAPLLSSTTCASSTLPASPQESVPKSTTASTVVTSMLDDPEGFSSDSLDDSVRSALLLKLRKSPDEDMSSDDEL
jgi:serine/threonine protein phosphatase PrpC